MLDAYLREAMRQRWRPGEHDCSAWPAKWAGIDLPAYSSDEQAQSLIDGAGGLVALWKRCIGDTLARANEPQRGDVGVIAAPDPDGEMIELGAIYTGQRWAMVTIAGVMFVQAEARAVWRVSCPQQ